MFELIYEFIFPDFCLGCEALGKKFCLSCQRKIKLNKKLFCANCLRVNFAGQFCHKCGQGDLDGLWVVANYQNLLLQRIIHFYKYKNQQYMAGYFARLMINTLQNFFDKTNWDLQNTLFMVVPLHKYKLRQRGFNQVDLFFKLVAEQMNLQYCPDLLLKIKKTKPQMELAGLARQQNLLDVFQMNSDKSLNQYDRVFIVDDVYTTGSTMSECAKVLKTAGAKQVWGLVLAKSSMGKLRK